MAADPTDPEAFEAERAELARRQRVELLAYIARHPSLASPAEIEHAGLPLGLGHSLDVRAAAEAALRSMSPVPADPCGTTPMFE